MQWRGKTSFMRQKPRAEPGSSGQPSASTGRLDRVIERDGATLLLANIPCKIKLFHVSFVIGQIEMQDFIVLKLNCVLH